MCFHFVNLDVMLARRKIRSNELAEAIGITPQNLSVLKAGRAKAIRFSTLEAICRELNCQPGDILEFSGPAPSAEERLRGGVSSSPKGNRTNLHKFG